MPRFLLIFAVFLIAACAPSPRQPTASRIDYANPAEHAIQDERLRELMAEMNSLVISEKEMTDHERDVRRRDYSLQMAKSAEALRKTVEAILGALPGLKLNAPDQATFQALASRLYRQSRELGELADNNRSDAFPGRLDAIDATCKACHRLFRATGS